MRNDLLTRRQAMSAGAGLALAIGSGLGSARGAADDRGTLEFRLAETAGLRRFGYPVHAILPGVRAGNHFRLTRGTRVIPAQFRAVDGPDGGPAVALDFTASPGPLEVEDYTISYGDDLEPGPEPKSRLSLDRIDGGFRVSTGGGAEL